MELKHYLNAMALSPPEETDVFKSLPKAEQILAKVLHYVEIRGKKNQVVPVILTVQI